MPGLMDNRAGEYRWDAKREEQADSSHTTPQPARYFSPDDGIGRPARGERNRGHRIGELRVISVQPMRRYVQIVLLMGCLGVLSGCHVVDNNRSAGDTAAAPLPTAHVERPMPAPAYRPSAVPPIDTPNPTVTSDDETPRAAAATPVGPVVTLVESSVPLQPLRTVPASPAPTLPAVSPDMGPIPTPPGVDHQLPEAPMIAETTITINTADYQSALVPTAADDPVYPYPRLQPERVGPPSPQVYRAIVLENRYLQLTILPELGGRIYRWVDKASGQNLFYENSIITPTAWGYRGWWLAAGGMEWALPVDEHGLSEATPWDFRLDRSPDGVGVTLSDVEERSRLVAEITIRVDAAHAYFTLTPRITNPTGQPVSFKFWINGMFGLGSPRIGPGLQFVLPGSQVTVHSTGDNSLPHEHELMDWPVFKSRDFSKYATWRSYLGVFAAPEAQASFMGAYNDRTSLGVVRIFPHQLVRGAKIFAPGDLDPQLWTTDGSSYFELWGGLAPTFWDEVTLDAGQDVTWQEHWYAVGDMGGFNYANPDAALNLVTTGDGVQVAAAGTRPVSGRLILWYGEDPREATDWSVLLSPERPFRGSYQPEPGIAGPWALSLVDEDGRVVASIGHTGDGGEGGNTARPAKSSRDCTDARGTGAWMLDATSCHLQPRQHLPLLLLKLPDAPGAIRVEGETAVHRGRGGLLTEPRLHPPAQSDPTHRDNVLRLRSG